MHGFADYSAAVLMDFRPQSQCRPVARRSLLRRARPCEAGLVARKDYSLVPPKVEGRSTRAGKSFLPIIAWTGGAITIGAGNLTFASGITALGDDISADGASRPFRRSTLQRRPRRRRRR